jgi:hypothetical protein
MEDRKPCSSWWQQQHAASLRSSRRSSRRRATILVAQLPFSIKGRSVTSGFFCVYIGGQRSVVATMAILPRIKICENRMNEAALKVERIGEAVSIIRLRLRRVLQDGSSSLPEINCGSLLLCCFATPSTADLHRAQAERRPQATTPQRPPSRAGAGSQR